MGVRLWADCVKCHRRSWFYGEAMETQVCDRCKERMMYNLPPWLCSYCWSGMPYEKPSGKIGLFGGRFGEWLSGEIGDISWLQWLIQRDCPKCGGTGEVEYKRPDPPCGSQAEANLRSPYFITTKEIIDAARRQTEKTVSQQCLEPIEDVRPIFGMER